MRLFERQIKKAMEYFFDIQDEDNYGWSWIRDISPNAQNTAEVVSVCARFSEFLTDEQKKLIGEAVSNWLLEPSINGAIVMDYVWIMYALTLFSEHFDEFAPQFPREAVSIAATASLDLTLARQNEDGGWADELGDASTTVRTGLAVYCIACYAKQFGSTKELRKAADLGIEWLVKMQNQDGGWGNQPVEVVVERLKGRLSELSQEAISDQYRSNAVTTGYALMALSSWEPHRFHERIRRGVAYIQEQQNPNGSYDIFYEIGMRRDVQFTFRHFGTIWALKGLFCSDKSAVSDPHVIKGIYFMLQLQDEASGAWKCAPDSDMYTWSTANALSILSRVYEIGEHVFDAEYRRAVNELMSVRYFSEEEMVSPALEGTAKREIKGPGNWKLGRMAAEAGLMGVFAFIQPLAVVGIGVLLLLELWELKRR